MNRLVSIQMRIHQQSRENNMMNNNPTNSRERMQQALNRRLSSIQNRYGPYLISSRNVYANRNNINRPNSTVRRTNSDSNLSRFLECMLRGPRSNQQSNPNIYRPNAPMTFNTPQDQNSIFRRNQVLPNRSLP